MTDQELIDAVAEKVIGDVMDGWPVNWNPLTTIAHMDMVLERMRERGGWLDIGIQNDSSEWWAMFTSDSGSTAIGTDITAMFRAILLAALDAVAHG